MQHLFVNAAAGDYHLIPTAAAINAGTSSFAPSTDLDGNPRPIGAGYDIGAYEFRGALVTRDYNRNGAVDAADYVVWRKGGTLQNEVVTPGSVTPEDYTEWRARFGNPPGSGAGVGGISSVPEPTGSALALLGLACSGFAVRV